jgi:predicted dehydrogenase
MRIAMIGAGGIARRHLDVLSAEPEVEIVGHVARTRASAERQASEAGGRAYDDVATLLAAETPDAAIVTVPPDAHGDGEWALIEARVPYLAEKPLSADRATGEGLAEQALAAGLPVAVGYHWRALDTLPEVRSRLGEAPVRMVLGAWHDVIPHPAWWRVRARSGGQMVEQATHLVDLARHLVGEPALMAAQGTVPDEPLLPGADVADASAALLRFPGGVPGVITATCALAGRAWVHLELVCRGLHVLVDQDAVRYDDGREVREVRTGADPFAIQDRAFLDAVRSGDPSRVLCGLDEALVTHRLTHDVLEAVAG